MNPQSKMTRTIFFLKVCFCNETAKMELPLVVKLHESTKLGWSQMVQVYVLPFWFNLFLDFHLPGQAEMSHMNRQQNLFWLPSQPSYSYKEALIKRPIQCRTHQNVIPSGLSSCRSLERARRDHSSLAPEGNKMRDPGRTHHPGLNTSLCNQGKSKT